MHINENIRVDGAEKIVETVKQANAKFHNATDLLEVVTLADMNLDIDISKNRNGLSVAVSLPGVYQNTVSLRCAINELSEILNLLENLPKMASELRNKLNQPIKS